MKRVLLVTNIPTPYRIPLFNVLNELLAGAGYQLRVVFGAHGYARRKWTLDMSACAFDYTILQSKPLTLSQQAEKAIFRYSGLTKALHSFLPDIVITSGFSLATFKVMRYCRANKRPFLIWSGAIPRKGYPIPAWRTWQRRFLVAHASGGVVYGTRAKEYLVHLGMPEDQVAIAINTVDTDFFQRKTEVYRSQTAHNSDKHTFLYVGHLTRGKRLDLLLLALAELRKHRNDFILVVVGDGPERASLEQMTNTYHLHSFVQFEGYKQRDELPKYLARAHCFIFPSDYDIWGLVLNEAMAAGLPCVASIHAGATTDLIENGVNGFNVEFSETTRVTDTLNWLLNHPEERQMLGLKAQKKIETEVSLEHSALGFLRALQGVN